VERSGSVRVARVYEPPCAGHGAAALVTLRQLSRKNGLTLLTATKAIDISHTAVLAAVIAVGR